MRMKIERGAGVNDDPNTIAFAGILSRMGHRPAKPSRSNTLTP